LFTKVDAFILLPALFGQEGYAGVPRGIPVRHGAEHLPFGEYLQDHEEERGVDLR